MAPTRKATRNAAGRELSEQQVEAEFTTIRDGRQRIKRTATLRTIKQYYEADDIEVTSMKVSLICPLSKARLKVPVRSVKCRHVECFDLRSYLGYHRQLTFWECPFSFCKAQARCDSLRVDEYMSEVLQATDDRVQEVEISVDGTFKAVQRQTPTVTETIDDEDPYVAEPIANESSDEPMETDAVPADQDQQETSSLAGGGEEQLREALRESRQQNETLRRELDSEKDENGRLHDELAAKVLENHELTTKSEQLQAQLDALRTAVEATQQRTHVSIEPASLSTDQDPHEPSSSLPAGDATQAATGSGPSADEESQLEHDASDASMPLLERWDASAMESDSDGEAQPRNAPKQQKGRRKTKQKGPFACTECGRVFTQSSNLRAHERIHTGEKPYKCGQCGTAFTHPATLRNHERLHTGAKPFKCEHCDKAFRFSGNLRRHERVHTGEKPYKCGHCGKTFAYSLSLRVHQRARHPVADPSKSAKKTASQAHSQSKA